MNLDLGMFFHAFEVLLLIGYLFEVNNSLGFSIKFNHLVFLTNQMVEFNCP